MGISHEVAILKQLQFLHNEVDLSPHYLISLHVTHELQGYDYNKMTPKLNAKFSKRTRGIITGTASRIVHQGLGPLFFRTASFLSPARRSGFYGGKIYIDLIGWEVTKTSEQSTKRLGGKDHTNGVALPAQIMYRELMRHLKITQRPRKLLATRYWESVETESENIRVEIVAVAWA